MDGAAAADESAGDLASITGLSLRSIRYYEELGLAPAAGPSKGGHRQYDQTALDRMLLIRKMKPLDFSLEEMASLLTALDGVRDETVGGEAREQAHAKLVMFSEVVLGVGRPHDHCSGSSRIGESDSGQSEAMRSAPCARVVP